MYTRFLFSCHSIESYTLSDIARLTAFILWNWKHWIFSFLPVTEVLPCTWLLGPHWPLKKKKYYFLFFVSPLSPLPSSLSLLSFLSFKYQQLGSCFLQLRSLFLQEAALIPDECESLFFLPHTEVGIKSLFFSSLSDFKQNTGSIQEMPPLKSCSSTCFIGIFIFPLLPVQLHLFLRITL